MNIYAVPIVYLCYDDYSTTHLNVFIIAADDEKQAALAAKTYIEEQEVNAFPEAELKYFEEAGLNPAEQIPSIWYSEADYQYKPGFEDFDTDSDEEGYMIGFPKVTGSNLHIVKQ